MRPQPPTTVVAALLEQASLRPGRPAFTVEDLKGRWRTLTYAELLEQSLRVATRLLEQGLRQGDRLLVCLPTSPQLLTVIYGTLLAGGACVPVYPPFASQGLGRWKEQALAIARVAQPCGAVVRPMTRLHMASVLDQVGPDLFTVAPGDLERGDGGVLADILPEQDLAFIQFTSGTTAEPRGVSITHRVLMANIQALLEVMPLDESDVSVSWLPPYHDMGLVGHIFVPVCCGVHQYLVPPTVLLSRPARWLQLVTRTRATQTTAPNFAYSMCAHRISRSERASIDLGSLRWALNGAETVQAASMERFGRTFAPRGFSVQAFRPVYGLAEATLTATFSPHGGIDVDWIDRERLSTAAEARPVPRQRRGDAQPIVSVGRPIPGHELRVVDDDGRDRAPRQVGEIWFSGPSVMGGYFNNPQATQQVLREGWLATGDLGYLDEQGLLHVTGRKKDLIIKGGRNYLPQDFEQACLDLPGLRPGRVVAFGAANPRTGTEDIVLVAEVRDPARTRDPVLRHRVIRTVGERTGQRPDRVELVEPGLLPKTTSGKLQRGRVKAAFEAGVALRSPPRRNVDAVVQAVRSALELTRARIGRMLGWQ